MNGCTWHEWATATGQPLIGVAGAMYWFRDRYIRCHLSDYVVADCLAFLREGLCSIVKRNEVRSPFVTYDVCKVVSDVVLPSSQIAETCACDTNDLFCNVAFASIRGINSLSLSFERTCREGAAYFIYSFGWARARITARVLRACLHFAVPSSPAHASCPTRGCLLPFDPHLPVTRHLLLTTTRLFCFPSISFTLSRTLD